MTLGKKRTKSEKMDCNEGEEESGISKVAAQESRIGNLRSGRIRIKSERNEKIKNE